MDEAARVLLVEDDQSLRETVMSVAVRAGYTVVSVADGAAAVAAVEEGGFDLVLLDIGLPVMDGWAVLGAVGSRGTPSVIVISAHGESTDKVRALDGGADDYLAKPFGSGELLARMRAVLRRAHPQDEVVRRVTVGEVTVDLGARVVARHGVEVLLTPTEYLLVAELARHAGQVLDHRTLLGRVWGPAYVDERSYLWTFVQRVRRKLEDDPSAPVVVVTVGRHGYRFGPERRPGDGGGVRRGRHACDDGVEMADGRRP